MCYRVGCGRRRGSCGGLGRSILHFLADSVGYKLCDIDSLSAEGLQVFDHVHRVADTWAVVDFKGYGSAASAGRGGEDALVWLVVFVIHVCPVSLPTERERLFPRRR